MTHADAVATNPALTPTDCPGELGNHVTVPDRHFVEGRMHDRIVDVYRCSACGWHVSLTAQVALNHYHVPEPRQIVTALAQRTDVPRSRAQASG